jgi:hypothetical protein
MAIDTNRVLYNPTGGRALYSPDTNRALYSGIEALPGSVILNDFLSVYQFLPPGGFGDITIQQVIDDIVIPRIDTGSLQYRVTLNSNLYFTRTNSSGVTSPYYVTNINLYRYDPSSPPRWELGVDSVLTRKLLSLGPSPLGNYSYTQTDGFSYTVTRTATIT